MHMKEHLAYRIINNDKIYKKKSNKKLKKD